MGHRSKRGDMAPTPQPVMGRAEAAKETPDRLVATTVTREELDLFRERYLIPPVFSLEVPKSRRDILFPRDFRAGFYEESFKAGLRLPLPDIICDLLRTFCLCPAQVAPNSWHSVLGFFSLCTRQGVTPTVTLFRHFFTIKSHRDDWWYFTPRKGCQMFKGLPSSVHGWKERYFFVFTEVVWHCSTSAGSPPKKMGYAPKLSPAEEEAVAKIERAGVSDLRELLSEESLVAAGLSEATPSGIRPIPLSLFFCRPFLLLLFSLSSLLFFFFFKPGYFFPQILKR
jgi:Putative gypsy type transposon